MLEGEAMKVHGIAEAHVEAAGKPELLANADRQHAAMDEECRSLSGRCGCDHRRYFCVAERITMHRRKKADRAQTVCDCL